MSADAAVTCACGKTSTQLIKLGWRATGTGDVVELARCEACLMGVVIGTMTDASICGACRRVVSGETDDPKACADRDGHAEMLCRACARRSHENPRPAAHARLVGWGWAVSSNEDRRLAQRGQLFVTRAAAELYLGHLRLRVEEARRELTELQLDAHCVEETDRPESRTTRALATAGPPSRKGAPVVEATLGRN